MASNLQEAFSINSVNELFKTKYQSYYDNAFNTSTPLWSQIRKDDTFYGKNMQRPWPLTYKGGVGNRVLPEVVQPDYATATLSSKKVYASDVVDRESIYASMSSEGAFVEAMAETIKKTVEADLWNHNRQLFGNGSLGTVNAGGVTDNTGGNYSIVISTATWKEANWEENMLVNFDVGTDKFQITSVTPSTRTVVVQRQTNGFTNIPVAGNLVYMQGSKDSELTGLRLALGTAISGSLYGMTLGRKQTAYIVDAASAGISHTILNDLAINCEKKSGQTPNLCVTSYRQYQFMLDLQEDRKFYPVTLTPRAENLKARFSFSGLGFMSAKGEVKIFPDKFCEDDRIYMLNTEHIVYYRRPGAGWVKDDIGGKGYLRVAGEDSFSAYIATYGDLWIPPAYHAYAHSLAT